MKVNRCFLIVLRTPIHRVLVARYLRDKKISKKSLNFKFNSLCAVKKKITVVQGRIVVCAVCRQLLPSFLFFSPF